MTVVRESPDAGTGETGRSQAGHPARVVGAVVAVALAMVGGLHGVWMVSTWPLAGREDFARLVVGVPVGQLPSPGLTAVVAGLLLVAGYLVAAVGGLVPGVGPAWVRRAGVAVVAAVLLLRGVGGLVVGMRPADAATVDFVRIDRILYSPMCILLGLGAAWVVLRALGSRRE